MIKITFGASVTCLLMFSFAVGAELKKDTVIKKDTLEKAGQIVIESTPYSRMVKVGGGKELKVGGENRKLIFSNKKIIVLGATEKVVEKKTYYSNSPRKIREQTHVDSYVSKNGKYALIASSYSDLIIPENISEENSDASPGDSSSIALVDISGKKLWEFKFPFGFEPGRYCISDSNNIVAVLTVCPMISWRPEPDEPTAKLWVFDMKGNVVWSYPSTRNEAEDFTGAGVLELSPNGNYIKAISSSKFVYFMEWKNKKVYKHPRGAIMANLEDNGIISITNNDRKTKKEIPDTINLKLIFGE
jgi:hypothetical protein